MGQERAGKAEAILSTIHPPSSLSLERLDDGCNVPIALLMPHSVPGLGQNSHVTNDRSRFRYANLIATCDLLPNDQQARINVVREPGVLHFCRMRYKSPLSTKSASWPKGTTANGRYGVCSLWSEIVVSICELGPSL